MTKDPNAEILTASEFAIGVAKKELGRTLDYSTQSLIDLEALIQHVKSHFLNLKKQEKLTEQTVQRASISIGGYLGEVLRRSYGGNWIAKNTVMKALIINGQEFSPIRYVFERLTKDLNYSLDSYLFDINQELHPQQKIEDNLPVPETSKNIINSVPVNRSLILIIIIISLLVIAGSGFGWYYLYGPCGTQPVKQAVLELFDNTEKFNDAYKVAASTSRIALANPISDMQVIQRNTRLIEVPACLENTKNWLVAGMQNYTDGFIAFMGDADDTEVDLYFATGNLYFSATTNEMNYISACSPLCITDPNKRIP
jgi:hypothetical protein